PTARHRRADEEARTQSVPGSVVPGMRGAAENEAFAPVQDRPLYRGDSRHAEPDGGGRIAPEAVPSTSGGEFGTDPYSQAAAGDPRQEAAGVTVCTRCGNSN